MPLLVYLDPHYHDLNLFKSAIVRFCPPLYALPLLSAQQLAVATSKFRGDFVVEKCDVKLLLSYNTC